MPRKDAVETDFGIRVATAIPVPLPVNVMGGEIGILEGEEVATVWSGPWGLRAPYPRANMRQITSQNPGNTYSDGSGATASDAAFDAGIWSEANKAAFLAEFPDARPGLLYGMLFMSTGQNHAMLEDMYSTSQSSISVRRNRNASDYHSNYFSMRKLFEPKVSQGGLWMITFPKPIAFHIGLRVGWDNGQGWYYFLYSLDPDFA